MKYFFGIYNDCEISNDEKFEAVINDTADVI